MLNNGENHTPSVIIPGLLLMLSRSKGEKMLWVKLPLDAFALLAQLSGALVWPILQWTLPNNEVI